jgi:hypothetical protein
MAFGQQVDEEPLQAGTAQEPHESDRQHQDEVYDHRDRCAADAEQRLFPTGKQRPELVVEEGNFNVEPCCDALQQVGEVLLILA